MLIRINVVTHVIKLLLSVLQCSVAQFVCGVNIVLYIKEKDQGRG